MDKDKTYERARKRVEAKIGFYIHFTVYIGVNILLIIINLLTSPDYLWFIWPLIGWGIGVFFHGMGTFIFSGAKFRDIKDRVIEKEIGKDRGK